MKQQQRMRSSDWAELIGRWQASGLTAEEFGRRNNINGKRLSWWKWQLGRAGRVEPGGGVRRGPRMLPVRVVASGTGSGGSSGPRQVEVVVRGGRVLRIGVQGEAELRGLIRMLEEATGC
jgi:transposase